MLLGRRISGILCLVCCHCDLVLDKWKIDFNEQNEISIKVSSHGC